MLRCLLALLLLCLPVTSVLAAQAGATQSQIKQLQSEIQSLQRELDAADSEQKTLQRQLRRAETDAGRVARQRDRLQQDAVQLKRELGQLSAQREQLNLARQQQAAALGEQLALAFRYGQQDKLKLLLNQEQPQRLARLLNYHRIFTAARIEAIERFNQTLTELQQLETTLIQKRAQLDEQQQALADREAELVSLRDQRRTALRALQREVKGQRQQLARLQQDQQRLRQVLKQLRQALDKADLAANTQPFNRLKGSLPWPTQGKVATAFGDRRGEVSSEGILIRAAGGQAVKVVHNGRVVYSDWLRGYGLLIIVDHGDGYMSLYGHNQSLLREVGDWVAAGEVIAKVGDSGGQATDGLYFAIRRQGKPQNPQRWLQRNRG